MRLALSNEISGREFVETQDTRLAASREILVRSRHAD